MMVKYGKSQKDIVCGSDRYLMLVREHEKLFPVFEDLNVAYVAFSPHGNGFLSGRYYIISKFENGVDFRSHMS